VPCNAAIDELETDQFLSNPFLFLFCQRIPADEILVKVCDPPVDHLVGGDGLAHLASEEHHPRLETKGVPSAEPRGFQAVRVAHVEQKIPDLPDPGCLRVHLETVLTGVAASRNHGDNPGHSRIHGMVEPKRTEVPFDDLGEDLLGKGPLDVDLARRIGEIRHLGLLKTLFPPGPEDPFQVAFPCCRVGYNHVMILAPLVHRHVVDDPAFLVRDGRKFHLPDLLCREVAAHHPLEQIQSLRSPDLDLAHVADIEDAREGAGGSVLVDHARILDGHRPSAELGHRGAKGQVPLV
jgi:hypothetical protein